MVPIIELGKRFKKLQRRGNYIDFIDEPVEGLVPVGDTGLYVTPDEPADPTDCDRYPSSPFCGGNPFTTALIDITPQIIIGDCDIGVRLTPALGFIKLPPVSLVYRKPECRTSESLPIEIVKDNGEKIQVHTGCGIYRPGALKYYVKKGISGGLSNVYEDQSWTGVTGFAVRQIITYKKLGSGTYEQYYDKVYEGQVVKRKEDFSYGFDIWLIEFIDCSGTLCRFCNIFKENLSGVDVPYRFQYKGIEGLATDDAVFITSSNELPNLYIVTENDEITPRKCPCQNYPPPPPKEICCMPQCCPPPDNDLLKVLIKKVNKLSEIVGVEEYPATLPASLISKDEGFLGNLIPNPDKKIPNLTQLLGWYIERFDEVMGQFEIPIEVKDSDPTIPGDQPLGMKLPNVAESIAEMMGLLLQSTINTESLVSLTTRTLIESGQDKQQNYLNYMLLQAVVDYLGFNYKENKVKLPMAFTPGKEKLEELLKETTLDIAVPEFDEKFNFQTDLIRLKEAAAIIKSVYFEKVNPFKDTKQEIMDKLKAARDLAKKINKDSEQEFEKFTSDAEIGFTNTTGITDSTSPYGYPYANRPKIRDISPSNENSST